VSDHNVTTNYKIDKVHETNGCGWWFRIMRKESEPRPDLTKSASAWYTESARNFGGCAMLNEKELNEKLAKRFGFTMDLDNESGAYGLWFFRNVREDLPNLTQSLDACVKWLVPRAIGVVMAKDGYSSDLAYSILFRGWLSELVFDMSHPALALCRAVEKLIDEEAKHDAMHKM